MSFRLWIDRWCIWIRNENCIVFVHHPDHDLSECTLMFSIFDSPASLAPIRGGTVAFAALAELEAALSPFPLTPPSSLNRELVNKTPPGARILSLKSQPCAATKKSSRLEFRPPNIEEACINYLLAYYRYKIIAVFDFAAGKALGVDMLEDPARLLSRTLLVVRLIRMVYIVYLGF